MFTAEYLAGREVKSGYQVWDTPISLFLFLKLICMVIRTFELRIRCDNCIVLIISFIYQLVIYLLKCLASL